MILYYALTFLYVLVCLMLLLVILLQQGKGGDMASAFGGGSSQTAFGARGGATLMTKLTTIFAVLFGIISVRFDEPGHRAAFVTQLALDVRRVKQVEHLGNAGLVIALAFAGADPRRPAEQLQEIVRYLAVPQLNGPIASRHALETLLDARDLADHVQKHFGIDAAEKAAGVVELIPFVGRVGPAR